MTWEAGEGAIRVDLDRLTKEEVAGWQPGDRLLSAAGS